MSNEMMMTEATQTTEGADASTQAVEGAATAAESTSQQQATEGQQATPAAAEEAKPEGAPEQYTFEPVEGVQVAESITASFASVAKELNLSQEAAQKVLGQMAPAIQKHQAEQIEAMRSEWANAATKDAEFGGEKLQENLSVAKKALEAFGTPELRQLLNESGLGNHPEVIRLLYRAGKSTSEDKFVSGASGQTRSLDERSFFANSNMNP